MSSEKAGPPVSRVRLFAVLRELAGASEVEAGGATVAEVVAELSERFGEKFAAIARRSSVVVDGERASPERPLSGREEVAILPPVSGG
ncbi:MAG: MoaD/ThiS family protein [Actinomycetota bacterium]